MKTFTLLLLGLCTIANIALGQIYAPLPVGPYKVIQEDGPAFISSIQSGDVASVDVNESSQDMAKVHVYWDSHFQMPEQYRRYKDNMFIRLGEDGQWQLPLRAIFVMKSEKMMEYYNVVSVENPNTYKYEPKIDRVFVVVPKGVKSVDFYKNARANAKALDLNKLTEELSADKGDAKQKLIAEEKARRARLEQGNAVPDSVGRSPR